MRRAPEQPRWALVVYDDNSMGCIPLEDVPTAITRRALVIAREDELLPVVSFNPPRVLPTDDAA